MKDLSTFEDKPSKFMRNHVIEILKANYANDNLEIDAFEERMEIAEHSNNKLELSALVRDLPEIKNSPDNNISMDEDKNLKMNHGQVDNSDIVISIFGGSDRKGVWKPPKNVVNINIFGGSDIDFREAIFNPGITTVNVVAVFGGADIIVPPGVNVKTKGIGIFGGFSSKTMDFNENSPTIVVQGVALFGGVDVVIKEPKKRKKKWELVKIYNN